jgi:hypothetical protein
MYMQVVGIQVLLRTDPVTDVHELVKGCLLGLIGVPITMYVHGKEIVIKGSTCSGIGAKYQ